MPETARTELLDSYGASMQRRDTKLLRILAMSRYAVGVAVVGTFFAATALLVDGAVDVLELLGAGSANASHAGEGVASSALLLGVSAVKAFLVAIAFYVIAIGFYQLFFHRLPLPQWLVVDDLAELELKLVEVVISTLGVGFLGQVVAWDGQRDLLGFGVATALVIAALAYAVSRVAPRQVPSAPQSRSDHD